MNDTIIKLTLLQCCYITVINLTQPHIDPLSHHCNLCIVFFACSRNKKTFMTVVLIPLLSTGAARISMNLNVLVAALMWHSMCYNKRVTRPLAAVKHLLYNESPLDASIYFLRRVSCVHCRFIFVTRSFVKGSQWMDQHCERVGCHTGQTPTSAPC